MASTQHGGCHGYRGRGRGVDFTVRDMGLIDYLGKTFFDKGALALYNDLDNRHVIGLKYYLFEDFDSGLEKISNMLGNLG